MKSNRLTLHIPLLVFLFLIAGAALSRAEEKPRALLLLEQGKSSAWTDMLRAGFEAASRKHGFAGTVELLHPDWNHSLANTVANAELAIVATDNLHEALRDNAAKFRRVKFGSIDAGIRAANVMSVTFKDEEAACLAGCAAAMLAAKSGRTPLIGWLSGEDSPAMRTLYNGFVEGAKLANPQIQVAQALVNGQDEEASIDRARQLQKQGAQVIALAAGAANPAVARTLSDTGIWLVLVDDQLEQPNVAGWLLRRPDLAVADIVASAATNFRGKEIDTRGLADGYVSFELSQGLARENSELFREAQRRIHELRAEMAAGNFHLPSLRARTLCDCLD